MKTRSRKPIALSLLLALSLTLPSPVSALRSEQTLNNEQATAGLEEALKLGRNPAVSTPFKFSFPDHLAAGLEEPSTPAVKFKSGRITWTHKLSPQWFTSKDVLNWFPARCERFVSWHFVDVIGYVPIGEMMPDGTFASTAIRWWTPSGQLPRGDKLARIDSQFTLTERQCDPVWDAILNAFQADPKWNEVDGVEFSHIFYGTKENQGEILLVTARLSGSTPSTGGLEEKVLAAGSGRIPRQMEMLLRELFGPPEAIREFKVGLEEASAGQKRYLIRFEQSLLPGNTPAEKLAHLSAVQGNLKSDLGFLSDNEVTFGLIGPWDATLKYLSRADVEIEILRQPGSSLEATFSDAAILYVATQALAGVLMGQSTDTHYEFYFDPAQSAGLEQVNYPDFSVGLEELFKAA